MSYFAGSIQHSRKSHNEDIQLALETEYGQLFILLDFARHTYPNLHLRIQSELKSLITSLSEMKGLSSESFLGYLATEINNFVHVFGQRNIGGKLFCVTAIGLLQGNRLTYLTYGDARINIFTDGRLFLLNGAKYQTSTVVNSVNGNPEPINENPQQMGRQYLELPLTERVQSLSVKDTDVILIFSDGLEEVLTPQRRLSELLRLKSSDPKKIYDAVMVATESAQDDRTLIVISGPYGKYVDPAIRHLSGNSEIQKVLEKVSALESKIGPIPDQSEHLLGVFERGLSGLESRIKSSIDEIMNQLSEKADKTSVEEELKKRLSELHTELLKQDGEEAITSREHEPPGLDRRYTEHLINALLESSNFELFLDQLVSKRPGWWHRLVAIAQLTPPSQELLASKNADVDTVTTPQPDSELPGEKPPQQLTTTDVLETRESVGLLDRFKTLLRIGKENKVPKVIKVGSFLLLVLAVFFLSYFLVQRSFWPADEAWRVLAQENRIVLTRHYEGSREASLQIDMSRSIPSGIEREKEFTSFEEAKNYIEKITKDGMALKPEATAATPDVDTVVEVKVEKNETLPKIAKRYGTTEAKLRELNPNVNWNVLKLGQPIRVPYGSGGSQQNPTQR